MTEEYKRLEVYVPRKLYAYDIDGECIKFGYFVSTAHVKSRTVDHNEEGKVYKNFYISLDYYISSSDDYRNIHVENGFCLTNIVFKDFESCKEYVDQLNKENLEKLINTKRLYTSAINEKFKEVMDFGKQLEEDLFLSSVKECQAN